MNKYHVMYANVGHDGVTTYKDYGYILAKSAYDAVSYASNEHGSREGLTAYLIEQDINMKINVQYTPPTKAMNKVTNFSEAAASVSSGQFVIGSVSQAGEFSLASSPVAHTTPQQARNEARRLAEGNPGKMFFIAKLYGAEFVEAKPRTFSI